METASAILTMIAFDHNQQLQAKLQGPGDAIALAILPYYRQILAQLQKENPPRRA